MGTSPIDDALCATCARVGCVVVVHLKNRAGQRSSVWFCTNCDLIDWESM